jgi:hypothetical protein
MKQNIQTYYFAYGSNLNIDQMTARCRGARPITAVELTGWRLVFRGVADIVESPGDVVNGAIYKITRTDELALDRYEGYNKQSPKNGMYSKRYLNVILAGEKCRLMFYTMNSRALYAPSAGYYNTIVLGYKDWRLPTGTLLAAVQETVYLQGSLL